MDRPYHVLFISRRNSARSLMAEAVVNRHGKGSFQAFSAGVEPTDAADPVALEVLEQAGYPTEGLRPICKPPARLFPLVTDKPKLSFNGDQFPPPSPCNDNRKSAITTPVRSDVPLAHRMLMSEVWIDPVLARVDRAKAVQMTRPGTRP